MATTNYTARWTPTGSVAAIANVSFSARSNYEAKQKADKIARELNVTRTPRTITKGHSDLIECIQTGVSQ